MTLEPVTIASDRLIARISPHGAELVQLTLDGDLELQWSGDPAIWKGRAPVLFPVIGLLRDGEYRHEGATYAMPKHGFARDRDFAMITRDASEVVFRLRASDDTRSIYPFEFQLDLRFRVVDTTLHIDAIIANLGGQPMPASFGFHPAFRWPLLFNQPREEHRLVFDRDEPAAIRRIDSAGLMKAMSEPSPVDGRELALRDDLFVDDALIFDQVASRSLRYGASVGPQLRVDFPNFSILGVWTKPGAEFVCIEPWHGLPDPEDASGDIWAKPGIMTIDVGATRTLRMAIAVEL